MDKINDAYYSVCGIVERIIIFYRSEVNSFCLDIVFQPDCLQNEKVKWWGMLHACSAFITIIFFSLNLQQPKTFARFSEWINIASRFEICQPMQIRVSCLT